LHPGKVGVGEGRDGIAWRGGFGATIVRWGFGL